jgi:hypothetical protein
MQSSSFVMSLQIIGLAGLYVGLPVLIVGAIVLISTRRARRGSRGAMARRARIGRVGGLIVGALAGTLAFLTGFGLLAPDLVAVGYLVGVLVTELRPRAQPSGSIRVASLQTRNSWRYLPRWIVPTTVGAGVLATIAPIVFAVVPPSVGHMGAWWLVSVQFAVLAVLALAGWVVLMARVAILPQPVDQTPDGDAVTRDRTNAARAIAGAVLGIELLVLGALAIVAGSEAYATQGAAYVAARILVWLGLGLALTGVLTWSILSRWRVGPAAPPSPADPGRPTPGVA